MIKRIIKVKAFTPFRNRRAGGPVKIVTLVIGVFIVVTTISWSIMKGTDIAVKSRARTLVSRFSDVIAENGGINSGMQTEMYKDFSKLKYFTGDYTIEFLTYSYTNPGAKVSLGTSINGSTVPDSTIRRGDIIHVVFRSSESSLDKLTKLASINQISSGVTAESGMKVD